jgi:hypothetical protein
MITVIMATVITVIVMAMEEEIIIVTVIRTSRRHTKSKKIKAKDTGIATRAAMATVIA